jgi:hypothetical protein
MLPDPPPPQPGLTRDLLLILGLPFLFVVVLLAWWQPWREYHVPSDSDIFVLATGVWDWAESETFCETSGHTIRFSADQQLMTITHLDVDAEGEEWNPAEYDLSEYTTRYVRGQIRGEERLTDAGEPVVWDLVLTSANSYHWYRTDWPRGSSTPEVKRCPVGASINYLAFPDA